MIWGGAGDRVQEVWLGAEHEAKGQKVWLKPGGGTGGRTKALWAWLGRGLGLEAELGGEAKVCGCV